MLHHACTACIQDAPWVHPPSFGQVLTMQVPHVQERQVIQLSALTNALHAQHHAANLFVGCMKV